MFGNHEANSVMYRRCAVQLTGRNDVLVLRSLDFFGLGGSRARSGVGDGLFDHCCSEVVKKNMNCF